MYPLDENLVALGLVVGLDYQDVRFDVHNVLQRMKLHPFSGPAWRVARWWNGGRRRFQRGDTTRSLSAARGRSMCGG